MTDIRFDDWRVYCALAEKKLLRLDQLITACADFHTRGQKNEAKSIYKMWIIHNSDNLETKVAMYNYAILLMEDGEHTEAIPILQECLRRDGDFYWAHISLGYCCEKTQAPERAIDCFETALACPQIDRHSRMTCCNQLGRICENLRRYEEAIHWLNQSLSLDPTQSGVIQHYVFLRQKACCWPVLEPQHPVRLYERLRHASPLGMLALNDDPALQMVTAQRFVQRYYDFEAAERPMAPRSASGKIRLGYLSGDLCVHAVGLLLPDLLRHHDRSRFEIIAFDHTREDNTQHRRDLLALFDEVHPIRDLSDDSAAQLIRDQSVDVLLDLHGLSSGARPKITSLRPARLQGTYLGFIGTTALPWMDFVVTDRYSFTPELSRYYVEEPVYLDGPLIPLPTRLHAATPRPREAAFEMMSLSNTYKLTPELLDVWARLLRRVAGARLTLLNDNPYAHRNLLQAFAERSVPAAQLRFVGRSSYKDYLDTIASADLFLDTTPYNCGSTARDVIHCKTPMVTLAGRSMVSRMCASMLHELGLDECIAHDWDDYEAKVCRLAAAPDARQDIAARIDAGVRQRASHHNPMRGLEQQLLHLLDTVSTPKGLATP